jgi:hypothetical protein
MRRTESRSGRLRRTAQLGGAAALALALPACARRPEPYAISSADPATLRSTPGGQVVGGRGRYDSVAWLGIPYDAHPWPG